MFAKNGNVSGQTMPAKMTITKYRTKLSACEPANRVTSRGLSPALIAAPLADEILSGIAFWRAQEPEDIFLPSFDGLRLHAKFYAASERKAPVQIMFHGYKSSAERDFCGGLREGIDGGFNVLLVDQRAHGESEGKYLTFGVNERFDCLSWASYAAERFGNDVKIYLYGISMGAATVLMASALPLPKSVSGIVADCGYTSPKAIICSVLRDHHVPAAPVYAVARLGARLFCGFDLDSASAPDALSRSHIPVLFIHGDDDRFVPCRMSRENFEASAAEHKKLLIVHNAGHGLSYMLDRPAYLSSLHSFLEANF